VRLLLFSLDDLLHEVGVGRLEVVLLELADEPALMPRHGELVGEAREALVAHKADDV